MVTTVSKVQETRHLGRVVDGSKTPVGNYPRPAERPKFSSMPTAAAQDDALPIPILPPRPRPVRVNLPNQQALQDATDRLSRAFRVETDPTLLLNAFLEEQLEGWVQGKLAQATKPAPEKKARKREPQP